MLIINVTKLDQFYSITVVYGSNILNIYRCYRRHWLTVLQVPRGVYGKEEAELCYDSDSVETVLSAFTSIYSGTTVGSLAVVAFVSSYVSVVLY